MKPSSKGIQKNQPKAAQGARPNEGNTNAAAQVKVAPRGDSSTMLMENVPDQRLQDSRKLVQKLRRQVAEERYRTHLRTKETLKWAKEANELTKENWQLTKDAMEKEQQVVQYYEQLHDLEEKIRADTLTHDRELRVAKTKEQLMHLEGITYKAKYQALLLKNKVADSTRGETEVQHDSVDEEEEEEGDRASEFSS